jgi:Xaa-Pro dipeptidase
MVFTIEPGLYFIPMLLEGFRSGADRAEFDWAIVDRLTPYGGIRVEDDVVVEAGSVRNLTRPELP